MFLGVKFLCDLQGKLSGRSKNHSLDFTVSQSLVLSQEFHQGKREAKSLSRAGQVSNDQVLAFPDVIKGLILDREQLGNASGNEDLSWFLSDLGEVIEVPHSPLGNISSWNDMLLLLHAHASCNNMINFRWWPRSWVPRWAIRGTSLPSVPRGCSRPGFTILAISRSISLASSMSYSFVELQIWWTTTSVRRGWPSRGRWASSIVTFAGGVVLRTSSWCFSHSIM